MEDKIEGATGPAAPAAEHPEFVDAKKRFRVIPLEWPLTFAGKVYREVTVRRMTAKDVADLMNDTGQAGMSRFPMFDVPFAVIDMLDADDADTVNEAVMDFLPRSLRTAAEPSHPSGDNTPA